jgi:hypothetical protein
MGSLAFVFNLNLSNQQVKQMLEDRVEALRNRNEMILAAGEQIVADIKVGKLPPKAMDTFISSVSMFMCL